MDDFNYVGTLLNADDAEKLYVDGQTYNAHNGIRPWSQVVASTGKWELCKIEIRSHSPAALRKIASRLFHEAAKLEAMQAAGHQEERISVADCGLLTV